MSLMLASSSGVVVMALYSWMLIVPNTRGLPAPIRLRGARLAMMYVIVVFFSFFSVLLVYDVVRRSVSGG